MMIRLNCTLQDMNDIMAYQSTKSRSYFYDKDKKKVVVEYEIQVT